MYPGFIFTQLKAMVKIAPDKKKHFYVGMLAGAIFRVFTLYFFPQHYLMGIIITLGLVIVLTYGFELFSLITKIGHYDLLDAVAGAIGGTIGMVVVLVVEHLHSVL